MIVATSPGTSVHDVSLRFGYHMALAERVLEVISEVAPASAVRPPRGEIANVITALRHIGFLNESKMREFEEECYAECTLVD